MTPEEILLANGFTLGPDKEWHKGDLSLHVTRLGSMACPHYPKARWVGNGSYLSLSEAVQWPTTAPAVPEWCTVVFKEEDERRTYHLYDTELPFIKYVLSPPYWEAIWEDDCFTEHSAQHQDRLAARLEVMKLAAHSSASVAKAYAEQSAELLRKAVRLEGTK